jgi:RimJ/RimL family protein N-acetyltransferase
MVDFKKIDWEKLKNPSSLFQVLHLTEDKTKLIAGELMNGFLNLDDNFRNYESIYKSMSFYFCHSFSVFYEVGQFQALLGITNIIPEHKADVMLKIFDKKFWGKDFVRETRSLLKLYMKELKLKRISAESPDPRIVKIAKMVGFKVEGVRNKDFRWDGKYYDNFLLGMEGRCNQ